jgi:hypothetical protein
MKEHRMNYLSLIGAESSVEKMKEVEPEKGFGERSELAQGVGKSGHYIGGIRLEPPRNTITVPVQKGKVLTTDGPFAETKEQLGVYDLIEARDPNEAIQVASRLPGARIGCVEGGRSDRRAGAAGWAAHHSDRGDERAAGKLADRAAAGRCAEARHRGASLAPACPR